MNIVLTVLGIICACIVQFSYGESDLSKFVTVEDHLYEITDIGKPLFLTPFIVNGSITDARKAANVSDGIFRNVPSYTGFLTVNKTYNKNLFIWFCPSESDYENDPVVLWLQGGPGASSLFGLFTENGPIKLHKDFSITLNKYSWTQTHSLLYIENPAGTGYSFTNDGGLNNNENQIGEELFEAIQQFFLLFPELRSNKFYITGESYAGKYIPAIGHTILMKNINLADDLKINLKGLAIGNGITDPINQLDLGEYAYQHGLVDSNTKRIMNQHKEKITTYISRGQYANATRENKLLFQAFRDASGFTSLYNYLYPLREDDEALVAEFVQRNDVRKAIHVGNLTLHSDQEVSDALSEDIMKSVADLLPDLLANYRVLFYNGQLDVRLPYPCMVNYLKKLNFSAAAEYKTAKRVIWHVDKDIAGYAKVAGNMTELLVRNSGHLVPTDQPEWAYNMIYRFTRNKCFD